MTRILELTLAEAELELRERMEFDVIRINVPVDTSQRDSKPLRKSASRKHETMARSDTSRNSKSKTTNTNNENNRNQTS